MIPTTEQVLAAQCGSSHDMFKSPCCGHLVSRHTSAGCVEYKDPSLKRGDDGLLRRASSDYCPCKMSNFEATANAIDAAETVS